MALNDLELITAQWPSATERRIEGRKRNMITGARSRLKKNFPTWLRQRHGDAGHHQKAYDISSQQPPALLQPQQQQHHPQTFGAFCNSLRDGNPACVAWWRHLFILVGMLTVYIGGRPPSKIALHQTVVYLWHINFWLQGLVLYQFICVLKKKLS